MSRLLLGLCLFATSYGVHAAEYRSITLANGRVVPAEIKSITATEMVLQTPQGELIISPSDLRDMAPMSNDAYNALPPWNVLVLPFGGEANEAEDRNFGELYSIRVLQDINAINPLSVNDLSDSVGESTKSALSTCGTNLQCATRHGADANVDVVVMGRIDPVLKKRVLTLGAVFVDSPAARKRAEITYTNNLIDKRKEMTEKLYSSLFLSPPEKPELITLAPVQKAPVQKAAPRSTDLSKVAWAPVPGITAVQQNNMAGFAAAIGVVGAGTATSVYMAGHATYSAPQMIAMTTLTSYGLTVFVNHLLLKK